MTNPNPPFLSLSAQAVAAVAKWASPDPTRPHIQMVLFARDEYVACDGHRLVIVPYDKDLQTPATPPPFGVDAAHLLAAVAAKRAMTTNGHGHNIAIEPGGAGGQVKIWLDGTRVGPALLVPARSADSYPPYKQVMPAGPEEGCSPDGYGLDPRYLAAIVEVNEATCPHSNHGVKIIAWTRDRLGPMAFRNESGVLFAIMPVRI